jgi:hypothetical protein
MKIPSTEVFDLIKSLDRHEKRYFKMWISRRKEDTQYLSLFDAIDAMERYDEKELLQKINNPALEKTIKYAKRDLFRVILNSLEYYHESENVQSRIFKKLKQFKILLDKGLVSPAGKILNEARDLALEHEMYPLILEIATLEIQLARRIEDVNQWSSYLKNGKFPHEDYIEHYREYLRLLFIEHEITYHLISGEYQGNKEKYNRIKEIAASLTDAKPKFRDRQTYLKYYHSEFLSNAMVRNWEVASRSMEKFLGLFEQQSNLMELAGPYLLHLYNYALSGSFTKDYDKALAIRDKAEAFLNSLPTKLNTFNVQVQFLNIEIIVLTLFVNRLDYVNAIKQGDRIHNSPYFQASGTPLKKSMFMTMCVVHFYFGKYKEALGWINRVVNTGDFNTAIRKDIDLSALMVNILIHFELGNFDLVESLVKSFLRSEKKAEVNDLVSYFLKFCREKLSKPGITPREVFVEFRDKLLDYQKSDFKTKYILEDFDFLAWVEAKIDNVPMLEKVKLRKEETAGTTK